MSIFTMCIFPESINRQTHVTMYLPVFDHNDKTNEPDQRFQTLWLLHGGGANHNDYFRKTSVERYAARHKLAVVCPDVGNSFYSDLPGYKTGERYYTYVSEELPELLRRYFPLSDKREDNFVVGYSMGGFGAAKVAFNSPDKYAAVGIMSCGPISPLQLAGVENFDELDENPHNHLDLLFEGGLRGIPKSKNDIWYVLEQAVKNNVDLPKIFNCCGTEDIAWPAYTKFKEFAKSIGLEVEFGEGPGEHDWDFWDEWLEKIIDWLPLKNRNTGLLF